MDGTFEDLSVTDIDAVVVPGVTINADTIRTDLAAPRIVREAYDSDKPDDLPALVAAMGAALVG